MDERMIEAVREFPCIWQLSNRSYKDLRAKENAWKAVVAKVGEDYTVDDCMRKWKGLRDKFVRELKKVKKKKTGQEGPAYVSCWLLFQHLTFISDTVKHRTTSSNFVEDTESSNSGIITEQNTQIMDDNGFSSSSGSSIGGTDELQHEERSETSSNSLDDSCLSAEASPRPSSQKLTPKSSVKRKAGRDNEIDELLISSLTSVRDKKPKVNDEEGYYGQVIAATLRRFTPRQNSKFRKFSPILSFLLIIQPMAISSPLLPCHSISLCHLTVTHMIVKCTNN